MLQNDKELLLKDLCSRLPYGVKIHIDFITSIPSHIVGDSTLNTITSQTNQTFDFVDFEQDYKNGDVAPIHGCSGVKLLTVDEFKPYLRPLSSMTEEESKEFDVITNGEGGFYEDEDGWIRCDNIHTMWGVWPKGCAEMLDWLNAHHFDYRGLIEKGLAIEAPADMYKN